MFRFSTARAAGWPSTKTASFAPRLRQDALRSGLIWQEILRIAASLELGAGSVARPLGYYWDGELSSFVQIHEWIDAKPVTYTADDQLLLRWLGRSRERPDSEMQRKKHFMDDLVALCHRIGAVGLARQFEWYTFVSQANVLTRRDPARGEFVAVDCCPGLAVPFFLPLSPAHAKIIWLGLKRGRLAHFDEVDLSRLDAYVTDHAETFRPIAGLIQQLKECDPRYRSSLPDVWHTRTRLLRDATFRRQIKGAMVQDWRRLGSIYDQQAERLAQSRWYWLGLAMDNLPVVGHWLLGLIGNAGYWQHIVQFTTQRIYRHQTLQAQRANDLLEWAGDRTSTERARALAASIPRYLLDKLALSWLPACLHRLMTDAQARRQLVQSAIILPMNQAYRRDWLIHLIEEQHTRGIITDQQAQQLGAQVAEPHMQGFIRDLGLTLGVEIIAKLVYIVLAIYGLSTQNLFPFVVAAFGPLPPSGILRAVYVSIQLACDLPRIIRHRDNKLLLTRMLGFVCAPWRAIGNLFAPIEMFAYYNDMSLLLADRFVSQMVDATPVFGGRGKLLEWWAFNLTYNLPLSLRRIVLMTWPDLSPSLPPVRHTR